MIEEWRDIKGYEGLYQVSNLGRVKSLERKENSKGGSYRIREGITLKGAKTKRGYWRVYLYKNGKSKPFSIHRLVAMAFIPNIDNKPCIDHIDCNKNNNCVDNLRWVTCQENMMNEITYTNNLIEHEKAKMPVDCFDLDGNFIKRYESIISTEKDGHSSGTVSQCCRGLKNKHHNMLWKYAS